MRRSRSTSFYMLSVVFGLFVAFLYGPMLCVYILSFQGPTGGTSFPMRGFSLQWYQTLFEGGRGVGDLGNAFWRSMRLCVIVAILSSVIAVAAGMAYRRKFMGSNFIFYTAIISMVVPGIFVGFGIALTLGLLGLKSDWWYSGVGSQLTWSLPFGLLIMFIVLGRFNPAYEEAATDLGATARQRFLYVILPIVLPGVIGITMAGFTSSYDEAARSSLNMGTGNTMPMELTALLGAATTPAMFAVGTLTTLFMFALVIGTLLLVGRIAKRRQLSLTRQQPA